MSEPTIVPRRNWMKHILCELYVQFLPLQTLFWFCSSIWDQPENIDDTIYLFTAIYCLFTLSINLFIYLSFYLSIYLSNCLSIRLSIYLFKYLSLKPSIYNLPMQYVSNFFFKQILTYIYLSIQILFCYFYPPTPLRRIFSYLSCISYSAGGVLRNL